jgi:uncharacterized protein involved in outer membrane biogenesis
LIGILAAAVVWLAADLLVQRTIERQGSEDLGVDVELKQASLIFLDGELALIGLAVANPDGYKGRLFELNAARTTIRPAALFGDEVVIDTLVINSPSLYLEHSLQGTNLGKVFGKIKKSEPETGEPKKQKTYRIKKLEINGARVTISSSLTGKPPVVITLPDIHMENVSSGEGAGLTLAQVFEKVFVKMSETAFRTGRAEIPADLLMNVSTDLSRYAPELGVGIPEKAKGMLEKAGNALRGLFK